MAVRVAILLLVLCVGRSQGPPLRDLSKLAEQMDDASISFNIYVSHEGVNQTVELSWRPRDDSADDRKQRAYGQCWLKLKGCSFNWLFRFRRPVSLSLSISRTHTALRLHCLVASFAVSCCFFQNTYSNLDTRFRRPITLSHSHCPPILLPRSLFCVVFVLLFFF